jgi:segregation and condensation protein B
MEMQLVRIVGRSDLPGRPFLFGTTPAFLEHFGLGSLDDLEKIEGAAELARPKEGEAGAAGGAPAPRQAEFTMQVK